MSCNVWGFQAFLSCHPSCLFCNLSWIMSWTAKVKIVNIKLERHFVICNIIWKFEKLWLDIMNISYNIAQNRHMCHFQIYNQSIKDHNSWTVEIYWLKLWDKWCCIGQMFVNTGVCVYTCSTKHKFCLC